MIILNNLITHIYVRILNNMDKLQKRVHGAFFNYVSSLEEKAQFVPLRIVALDVLKGL